MQSASKHSVGNGASPLSTGTCWVFIYTPGGGCCPHLTGRNPRARPGARLPVPSLSASLFSRSLHACLATLSAHSREPDLCSGGGDAYTVGAVAWGWGGLLGCANRAALRGSGE